MVNVLTTVLEVILVTIPFRIQYMYSGMETVPRMISSTVVSTYAIVEWCVVK